MERRVDRLIKYLKFSGINENQATILCGLSKGLIGKAKTGKVDLGNAACAKVLDKFQNLSRVWLLTGEGTMLNYPSQINSIDNIGTINGNVSQSHTQTDANSLRCELERLRATNEAYKERIAELKEERKQLLDIIANRGK